MITKKGNLSVVKNIKDNNGTVSVLSMNTDYELLCKELAHSRSLTDLNQRIHKMVKNIGFTDYLFFRLERVWQSNSQYGLLHSFPEELMRIYHEDKLYEVDLLIEYSRSNTHSIFSSQIYNYIDDAPFELGLTQDNRRLTQLYKRFSIYEHCVLPMSAVNGSGHVQLLLTSTGMGRQGVQAIATKHMASCRALCKAIDSVSTKKFRSAFIDQQDNPVRITRKPLLILRRLASSDVTTTELANEMGMSPITAHQHISAARKALSAKTNIGAIVKAIKTGLIKIE